MVPHQDETMPAPMNRPAPGRAADASAKDRIIVLLVLCLAACQRAQAPSGEVRSIRLAAARFEMVYVPAGEFLMGSVLGWEDERPVHRVRISSGFWLGRTEVTQGVWRAVMGANPAGFRKGDDFPVEQVGWNDCQEFIRRLNRLTGAAFRLPNEAEWEYACRAGSSADRVPDLEAQAWFDRNSGGTTHAVGLKRRNAFGLHDMLGNVWEWCADGYDAGYYARSPLLDPAGDPTSSHRVDRGGAWGYGADIVRPSRRDGSGPDYRINLLGMRLAASRL
jgi:formylglycine-generating enzyme required for sulfatase activity